MIPVFNRSLLNCGSNILKFVFKTLVIQAQEKDKIVKRLAFAKNTSAATSKMLESLNFSVDVFKSRNDLLESGPFLMVANHISYLDIFVISKVAPALFVTSKEMQATPILGLMCEAGGSVFVDRKNPHALKKDLIQMKEAAGTGSHLVVFPEGTSGSGERIMPFKGGLVLAAKTLSLPVLPVCIRYLEINGEPFCEANHKTVAWYADMKFASHFLKLGSVQSVKVQIAFLEPIEVSSDSDIRAITEKARQRISDFYHRGNFPKWASKERKKERK